MKKRVFTGVCTALVTPMKDGEVDYDALKKLIDFSVSGGVDALCLCGTTGEKSTLKKDEHIKVLRKGVEAANGRVPVLAGTGSNDTSVAVEMTKIAGDLGVSACLAVTPYYNRATQEGLYQNFCRIADASKVPVLLYEVPSRTGVSVDPKTYERLAQHENVYGVKDACGDIKKTMEILSAVPEDFAVYAGDDALLLPTLAVGGAGVVSVAANVIPREVSALFSCFTKGDTAAALKAQKKMQPLIKALFYEVNPIPVKFALSKMGLIKNELRLPLTPLSWEGRAVLAAAMEAYGL